MPARLNRRGLDPAVPGAGPLSGSRAYISAETAASLTWILVTSQLQAENRSSGSQIVGDYARGSSVGVRRLFAAHAVH